MANVGVYSYLSTKVNSTLSELLYSVVLQICNNKNHFSPIYRWVTLATLYSMAL